MVARLWHGRQEADNLQYAIESSRSGWEAWLRRDSGVEIRQVARLGDRPLSQHADPHQARTTSVLLKSSPVKSSGMPATDATAYDIQSPKFKAAG